MKSKNLLVALIAFVSLFLFSTHAIAQTRCCRVPDSLKVLSVTDSSFCVSWHRTDSIPCDSATTGNFRYRKIGTTTWKTININYHSSTTLTFCDTATSCTLYQWQVRNACKSDDTTTYSSYVSGPNFTTTCDTPRTARKSGVPISLYPNPAKGSITLTGKYETASTVHITVSDMTGITRLDQKAQVFNKSLNLALDISRLPKGVYFITVSDDKTVSKVSFIKEE